MDELSELMEQYGGIDDLILDDQQNFTYEAKPKTVEWHLEQLTVRSGVALDTAFPGTDIYCTSHNGPQAGQVTLTVSVYGTELNEEQRQRVKRIVNNLARRAYVVD